MTEFISDMRRFGLTQVYHCDHRLFFLRMNHPGASNCDCPKFDGGLSCVPHQMKDAWYAYIGLTNSEQGDGV